jgi:hypothetical protein
MTRSSRCASPLRPSSHFFLSRVLSSPFLTPLSTGCCSDRWGDGQSSFGPYLPLEIYCESYFTPIPSSLLPFFALLFFKLICVLLSCLVLSPVCQPVFDNLLSCVVFSPPSLLFLFSLNCSSDLFLIKIASPIDDCYYGSVNTYAPCCLFPFLVFFLMKL